MKARILVIEDEMSINDLLCMNLEIAGYETVGYLDGNEAYEAIIQDHAFQCALVDIMLPGRDGYSLLPKLKQYEIPVIFLTAKGDIASKIKGLKDGAEDYIVKPFEMLEVMVRLEKVLERNGTVQEQIQNGEQNGGEYAGHAQGQSAHGALGLADLGGGGGAEGDGHASFQALTEAPFVMGQSLVGLFHHPGISRQ